MESDLLLRGVYIGLAIAAPVGPIGVLCITRTLAGGRTAGFFTGLGAASADAVYGSVAGFGLTIVSDLFLGHEAAFRIVGGVFLCLLGLRTFFRRPPAKGLAAAATTLGLAGAYASALVLTLTNPLTILSFAAVFAGLGLAEAGGSYLAAVIPRIGPVVGAAQFFRGPLQGKGEGRRHALDKRGLGGFPGRGRGLCHCGSLLVSRPANSFVKSFCGNSFPQTPILGDWGGIAHPNRNQIGCRGANPCRGFGGGAPDIPLGI
jgi:threonine/homoserine/homoserine lactone efflux protein